MINNKNRLFRSRFFCFLYVGLFGTRKIRQGSYMLDDLMARFGGDRYTKKERKKIARMILNDYAVYGFQVNEWFFYNVRNLSDYGKRLYITEGKSRWHYYAVLNKPENTILFDDKSKTYELFQKYYRREILTVRSAEDRQACDAFVAKYPEIIVKPIDGAGGKGVAVFAGESFDELMRKYEKGFILEPRIRNAREIADFHPQSLNTIRIVTIRMDDKTIIPLSWMRLGKGDSCMDNVSSGGISCFIDVESGVIIRALDKKNNFFIFHPDTHKQILGFTIPRWEEAKAIVKELAMVVPSNRFTGWDLALTDDGWALVEANARSQLGSPQLAGNGCKPLMDGILSEMDLPIEK